jgi:tRNA/rRNA methyltransferase
MSEVVPKQDLERFHVVLVEPLDNLNIGAVARAMMNFGFKHLHLVKPEAFDIKKARVTACWADKLLESAQLHDDLGTMLREMEDVIGFSGRAGRDRSAHVFLPEWALESGSSTKRTALLFGSEDNGLRREHVELCRKLVRIPSTVENPSFNLAQAVLLALSEVARVSGGLSRDGDEGEGIPDWNDFEQLDRMIESVSRDTGFIRKGTSPAITSNIKNIFRRTEMNKREMRILLGLFGRIDRTLRMRGKGGGEE